jgi:hypothetical protein
MILPDDFRDFLLCLNARRVEYLVLGGHAVSFHGYPRFTHDVDVFVWPALDNAERLLGALQDFGFGAVEVTAKDFTVPVTVVLGRAPYEIDVMTYIKGVVLEEAWRDRVAGVLDTVPVHFLSKAHLIQNKLAVGRPEDHADVARLRS